MGKDPKTRRTKGSSLSSHKKEGKKLLSPFLRIPNLKNISWINDRAPEMLWVVLIFGGVERTKAFSAFRRFSDWISENKGCYDITHTGISLYPIGKRQEFIQTVCGADVEITKALRPLALFDNLPAKDEWRAVLEKPIEKEDYLQLAKCLAGVFSNSSQEATDCRWFRFLCYLKAEKLFMEKDDILKGIYEYPDFGPMKMIRPCIRAGEGTLWSDMYGVWSKNFWENCFSNTNCSLEEENSEEWTERKKIYMDTNGGSNTADYKKLIEVNQSLIDHFVETQVSASVNARHEIVFGFGLYSIRMLSDSILNRSLGTTTGRLMLRSLVEIYITFKYLLLKELTDLTVWDQFQQHGIGIIKLIYLKGEDGLNRPQCLNAEAMESYANEQKSVEFVPITIGNWDDSNLRKMSIESGTKEIYDTYYDYTSNFVHGNWASIREVAFQHCLNPLHRLHLVPLCDYLPMKSVLGDAVSVVNLIMGCINDAYPQFSDRVVL